LFVLGATASLSLALAAPAAAHQLSRAAADLSTGEFLMLGVKHMLLGWDHLLFIAGVLMLAHSWQVAAKWITVFVIGHSTTLILGTELGWSLNPGLVDLVIAGSVIFVGGLLVMKTQLDSRLMLAIVAAFGLIHGLGLAARFSSVGLTDGVLAKVLLFNVGIEIGQLCAIAVMAVVGKLLGLSPGARRQSITQPLALGIVGAGVLALALALYTLMFPRIGDVTGYVPPSSSSCRVEINADPLPEGAMSANPPLQHFYPPTEKTPGLVFEHARSDGYLTIYYPAEAGSGELAVVEEFVMSKDGIGVLAGPGQETKKGFRFTTFYELMVCEKFEEQTMKDFAEAWFKTL
jgi:hydrogenase/urease accessory protein HupE